MLGVVGAGGVAGQGIARGQGQSGHGGVAVVVRVNQVCCVSGQAVCIYL